MFKILSIRGGGIRGLAPAEMFAGIEKNIGRPIGQCFDLIAGTSTGSILAVGLALGIPASDLANFYIEDGPKIFKRRFGHRLGLLNSKYDSKVLRDALDRRLGLHFFMDCTPRVLVPASDVLHGTAKFFRSWRQEDMWIEAAAVCQASASAPTYFDPMVWMPAGIQTAVYEDGGLFANNPALYALAEAHDLTDQAISVLDIACPSNQAVSDTSKGAIGFVPEAISMLMGLGMEANRDAVRSLLGSNYTVIQPPLNGASGALDDASIPNLAALKKIGAAMIDMTVIRPFIS